MAAHQPADTNSPPSYAPKSPDLSSFYATEPKQEPPSLSLDTSSKRDSSGYHPPASAPTHQHRHHPYQHPAHHEHQEAYVPPRSASFGSRPSVSYGGYPTPIAAPSVPVSEQPYYPVAGQYAPNDPYSAGHTGYPPASYGQAYPPSDPAHFSSPTAGSAPEYTYPPSDPTMPTRRQAAAAALQHNQELAVKEESYDEPLDEKKPDMSTLPIAKIEPGVVRTKFPTARIKRIMQADEEVGKVAQQTPIAVGKALEMFMINLVTKSADVAQEKGSKRVSANMLKQVVETDDQWDFLREIVSKVEAEKEGKGKAKMESESEEENFAPKKKGRGRKKKNPDQE